MKLNESWLTHSCREWFSSAFPDIREVSIHFFVRQSLNGYYCPLLASVKVKRRRRTEILWCSVFSFVTMDGVLSLDAYCSFRKVQSKRKLSIEIVEANKCDRGRKESHCPKSSAWIQTWESNYWQGTRVACAFVPETMLDHICEKLAPLPNRKSRVTPKQLLLWLLLLLAAWWYIPCPRWETNQHCRKIQDHPTFSLNTRLELRHSVSIKMKQEMSCCIGNDRKPAGTYTQSTTSTGRQF